MRSIFVLIILTSISFSAIAEKNKEFVNLCNQLGIMATNTAIAKNDGIDSSIISNLLDAMINDQIESGKMSAKAAYQLQDLANSLIVMTYLKTIVDPEKYGRTIKLRCIYNDSL